MSSVYRPIVLGSLLFSTVLLLSHMKLTPAVKAQSVAPHPSPVLVELFTSEGCSSCPPADALLRQLAGHSTAAGQMIVGVSEHVSYWNGLGWQDPYSSKLYTDRQSSYAEHFGLDSVYTPQMVVNGREQFVGSDRRALQEALATEANSRLADLHITSAHLTGGSVTFTYSAKHLRAPDVHLVAILVDDLDGSDVKRGENSGRHIDHASVARGFVKLGAPSEEEDQAVTLPVPASLLNKQTGHHLVLFAQKGDAGPVLGVDAKPL